MKATTFCILDNMHTTGIWSKSFLHTFLLGMCHLQFMIKGVSSSNGYGWLGAAIGAVI